MTDIEICNNIKYLPIKEIANKLNLTDDNLILYGNDKAKVKKEIGSKKGKLILVTAMSPTPYGEGKTTVSIGLADAFSSLGDKVSLALRQPSLGPVFGLKGGATGGGYSQVVPMTDINLHFTGDFHAITSCNNLVSAAIYNHIEQGNSLGFSKILFKRAVDMNDRSLRDITLTCNKKEYSDSYAITSASEIMTLFCLASSLDDLKKRLGNLLLGLDKDGNPITAHDLKLEGALTALLKDAFLPNLVQTLEGTPAFIHGGPFANIAHGCSSVISIKLALSLSDYVITEAGFGADLGAEKFMNLFCNVSKEKPSAVVLVVTIRSILHHGNDDFKKGLSNIDAHLEHLSNYNIPIVVCCNHFNDDKDEFIDELRDYIESKGYSFAVTDSYTEGGIGAIDLANKVKSLVNKETLFTPLLTDDMTITKKLEILGEKVYHAKKIDYTTKALEKLKLINKLNLEYLPICVAKTQYSISDDAKKLGFPKDNDLTVQDIVINQGAGFITILLGKIVTMPGLPKNPNYEKIDVVDNQIIGIF